MGFEEERKSLLDSLKGKGFSKEIAKAFKNVRREDFISAELLSKAYHDMPLPIGHGQTISQPYTIAFMISLLDLEVRNDLKILEVGSGCGYVLALLSKINKKGKIFGIELIEELATKTRDKLKDYKNIKVVCGDGKKGLERGAPYDRILISAAANNVSEKLKSQLKIGGILVAPIKNSIRVIKKGIRKNKVKEIYGFSFVPLR